MLTPQIWKEEKSQKKADRNYPILTLPEIDEILWKKPDETEKEFNERFNSKGFMEKNRRSMEELEVILDWDMTDEEKKLWANVD